MTEPVLWLMPDGKIVDKWGLQFYGGVEGEPLYKHPPKREWTGLTPADIREASYDFPARITDWYDRDFKMFINALETKLKEKNA